MLLQFRPTNTQKSLWKLQSYSKTTAPACFGRHLSFTRELSTVNTFRTNCSNCRAWFCLLRMWYTLRNFQQFCYTKETKMLSNCFIQLRASW